MVSQKLSMKAPKKEDNIHLMIEKDIRKKFASLWFLVIAGFLLCVLGFSIWLICSYDKTFYDITLKRKSDYSAVCTGISDLDRFDCHPEPKATEESCLQRGCCFRSAENSVNKNSLRLNIPYCFYPSNYDGYSIENITQDGRHIRADLKRSSPSGFPK